MKYSSFKLMKMMRECRKKINYLYIRIMKMNILIRSWLS